MSRRTSSSLRIVGAMPLRVSGCVRARGRYRPRREADAATLDPTRLKMDRTTAVARAMSAERGEVHPMNEGVTRQLREPWRRFEVRVDPENTLTPAERARRAKISYRAFMRSIARKAAKARAASKAGKDAALRRRLAMPPTEQQVAEFRREISELFETKTLWAASQRGERGIADVRRRQLERRDDCLLCHRPFSEANRESELTPAGRRRRERRLSSADAAGH